MDIAIAVEAQTAEIETRAESESLQFQPAVRARLTAAAQRLRIAHGLLTKSGKR